MTPIPDDFPIAILAAEAGYSLREQTTDRWVTLTAVPRVPGRPVRHACVEITSRRRARIASLLALDDMRRSLAEAIAEQHGTFVSPARIGVPS